MAPIDATAEQRLQVQVPADVERARSGARSLARALGFDPITAEMVVLAVSELATNLVRYAHDGEITLRPRHASSAVAIEVDCRDAGPGIADLAAAVNGGASTGGGLGVGLAGVRRLMDHFEIASDPNGTRVVCRKWRATS